MKRHDYEMSARCEVHDKIAHSTRKRARRVARTFHAGEDVREYPCTAIAGWWHVGHRAPAVTAGRLTAKEVYRR
nr:hypothetical protein [Micromonospora sp. DSM 115978]